MLDSPVRLSASEPSVFDSEQPVTEEFRLIEWHQLDTGGSSIAPPNNS